MVVATVRHGPTAFGLERRIAGRLDVPLDPGRVSMLDEVKPAVTAFEAEVVVSSPLARALESARLCTSLPRDAIVIHDGCAERDYGDLEGLRREEIERRFPGVRYIRTGNRLHSVDPPRGETFPELRRRAESFCRYLLHVRPEKRILVFSHHTFLQQLHGVLAERDTYECLDADIHNLELNYFHLDSNGSLIGHEVQRAAGGSHGEW